MVKITTAASALLTSALLMAAVPASAQVGSWRYKMIDQSYSGSHAGRNKIGPRGRCGGISYGTGSRRCGSLTGGPSGGLAGRS